MEWIEKGDDHEFYEGDRLLAAVPVRDREWDPPRHYWDIGIVTVDEHGSLWVEDSGDAYGSDWGWTVGDIDFFIPFDQIKGALPEVAALFPEATREGEQTTP